MQELKPGDCISLCENNYTNNKLYIEQIEKGFKPSIRSYLLGQYCFFIIDKHASHISTEFIKFI